MALKAMLFVLASFLVVTARVSSNSEELFVKKFLRRTPTRHHQSRHLQPLRQPLQLRLHHLLRQFTNQFRLRHRSRSCLLLHLLRPHPLLHQSTRQFQLHPSRNHQCHYPLLRQSKHQPLLPHRETQKNAIPCARLGASCIPGRMYACGLA